MSRSDFANRVDGIQGEMMTAMILRKCLDAGPVSCVIIQSERAVLLWLLIIVLLILSVSSAPVYPYSRRWGYYPAADYSCSWLS